MGLAGLAYFGAMKGRVKESQKEKPVPLQMQAKNRYVSQDAIDYETRAVVIGQQELAAVKKECGNKIDSVYSQASQEFPEIPKTRDGAEKFLNRVASLVWKDFKQGLTLFIFQSFTRSKKGVLDCDSGSFMVADVLGRFGLKAGFVFVPEGKGGVRADEYGVTERIDEWHIILKIEFPGLGDVYFEILPESEWIRQVFFWSLEELEQSAGGGKAVEFPVSGNGALIAATKASAHFSGGFYKDAVGECKYAISLQPDWRVPYVIWGECLANQKDYGGAFEWYEKAAEVGGDYPLLKVKRAKMLIMLGRDSEASVLLDEYLGIVKGDSHAHLMLGVCLHKRGKYAEAESQFSLAISISPKYAQAFAERAKARFAMGKTQEAEADMEMSKRFLVRE